MKQTDRYIYIKLTAEQVADLEEQLMNSKPGIITVSPSLRKLDPSTSFATPSGGVLHWAEMEEEVPLIIEKEK